VTTVRTGAIADLRNWLPIERFGTVREVEVEALSDLEAWHLAGARPTLRDLLFAGEPVREVAGRPFSCRSSQTSEVRRKHRFSGRSTSRGSGGHGVGTMPKGWRDGRATRSS
jgi:hypothetical protein